VYIVVKVNMVIHMLLVDYLLLVDSEFPSTCMHWFRL
jgi:hypothetical protein